MVFGTQMQATARAIETSRVLRMEPRQYHALAAASPEFQAGVGRSPPSASAACRGSPPRPPKPQVVVVGNRWDPASHDLKRFLSRNQILYEWLTLDEPDIAGHWQGALPGRGRMPGAAPRRRHHPLPPGHPRARRGARPRHRARRPRLRHGDHRRRPRRPRRRGLRRLRGPADARRRMRGAGRPGRDLVADRELPRLPERHLRRRARQPRAAPGPPARRRDPDHPQGDPASTPSSAPSGSTATRRSAPAPSSSPPA